MGLEDHATAQALIDENGWWQILDMQQGADVGPICLDVAVRRIAAGGAVAAQIARHHALTRAEEVYLRLPVVGAGKAVHEDQRRIAFAPPFVEKSCAPRFQVGHASLLSSKLLENTLCMAWGSHDEGGVAQYSGP
jgi:hypothetical protein